MAECEFIRIKHRKLCTGDLQNKITIKSRDIVTPSIGVDFNEKFKAKKKAWAAIKTTAGIEGFAGTNMSSTISHIIYMRCTCSTLELTSENWLEYRSKTYDIMTVENIDERNEWLALYCNERGVTSQRNNFS